MKKSKIVCLIPARKNSKGIKNKNLLSLNGHPLIAYSILASKSSSQIKRTIVSTDSNLIGKIATSYGAEVPFLRPASASEDGSTDYDVIKHFLNWIKKYEKELPDYIVYLRPTTPIRETKNIDLAIKHIKDSKDATALRSVHKMSETSYKNLRIKNKYLMNLCSDSYDMDLANLPRQEYETTYSANGYIDIFIPSFIEKHKSLLGDKVVSFVTHQVAELDVPQDIDYLKYQFNKNSESVNKLFL